MLTVLNRAEIIQWVAESLHPFKIVKDHGFNSLMKMGWPSYYLPHLTTVSQDVKTVFAKTQQRIASLLQVIHQLVEAPKLMY